MQGGDLFDQNELLKVFQAFSHAVVITYEDQDYHQQSAKPLFTVLYLRSSYLVLAHCRLEMDLLVLHRLAIQLVRQTLLFQVLFSLLLLLLLSLRQW